ncbi:MAG: DegT/DnrJ/EryC1/StrS aminotransferase family protein [Rhodospirillales bacterium]
MMNTTAKAIPLVDLHAQRVRISDLLEQAIADVLTRGQFIMGPEVAEFEDALANYAGAKHCISCANGTDALMIALMARGIGPGDAVFVPAFTFPATAEVVALLGATPFFIDVLEDTFNISPDSLQRAIGECTSRELRPAAVIPVDLFGLPVDYESISAIAEEHGLFVLCDAAQSMGAISADRKAGSFGHATATSFFPAKPLGCYGDGGAVLTDNDELAEVLRSIRQHGKGGGKYEQARVGVNSRLDTLQAAILLPKLEILEDEMTSRNRVAARYAENLADAVSVPVIPEYGRCAWAQYTIKLEHRDKAQAALKDANIACAIYYPKTLNRQAAYASYPVVGNGVPVSESLTKTVLSLPMHPYLQDEDIDRVVQVILKIAMQ